VLWTEAAFSACLARHWPDHHWQCNWQVAWTSLHMCVGKRQTFRATFVTIFSDMTKDVSVFVKCDKIVRLLFWKLPHIRTSNFCKVVCQHTEGMVGRIIWVLLEIYFSFQQWETCENPLRTDKVIAMSLAYYFFGTQCIHQYSHSTWWGIITGHPSCKRHNLVNIQFIYMIISGNIAE